MRSMSLVLLAMTLTAAPVSAQTAPGGAPATAPAPAAAAGQPSDPVTPQGFTYAPEGRRDPFVSLVRRGS